MESKTLTAEGMAIPADSFEWSLVAGRRTVFHSAESNAQFSGWLVEARKGKLLVRSNHPDLGSLCGKYLFQVFTADFDIMFVADFQDTEASCFSADVPAMDAFFLIGQQVCRVPVKRDARKLVIGQRADMRWDTLGDIVIETTLADCSMGGASVYSPTALDAGSKVTLTIDSQMGRMTLEGKVVNCAQIRADWSPIWRLGMAVRAKDRVSEANLRKLVQG